MLGNATLSEPGTVMRPTLMKLADHSGSISTSFALALIPILGMAGVAVDYSGAASARTHLQSRTDAAALQIAKGSPTSETVQKSAQAFFATDSDASGAYAGVLIYQDRTANFGAKNKLNGDSNTMLKGAIYTPTQSLEVTENAGFGDQSSFMPMIADTVSFSGSSVIQSDVKNTQTALPMAMMTSGSRLTE